MAMKLFALAGLWIATIGSATAMPANSAQEEIREWSHDLRSLPEGADNRGGAFGPEGWTMNAPRGFLRITLPGPAPAEGALIISIRGVSGQDLAKSIGADRKVHFLNMFSNPIGDHHVEGGGTATDALWTLRLGTDERGSERYLGGAKILWASRGAKRTAGSDYHEKRLSFPAGVEWDNGRWTEFRVDWSAARGTLRVSIDGTEAITVPWTRQGDPLRHVFLGGAADFAAFQGASFRDLRIVRSTTTSGAGR